MIMRRFPLFSLLLLVATGCGGGTAAVDGDPIPELIPCATCPEGSPPKEGPPNGDPTKTGPVDRPPTESAPPPVVLGKGFVSIPLPSSLVGGSHVYDIRSVWSFGPNDAFLGASDDRSAPVLLHWNGATWEQIAVEGATRANGIDQLWASSPTDLWGVASFGGEVFHWDGVHFARFDLAAVSALTFATNVAGSGPNDVWLSGGTGSGAKTVHWNGAGWEDRGAPTRIQAPRLLVAPSGDTWAISDMWRLSHWSGSSWVAQTTTLPPAEQLWPAIATTDAAGATKLWLGSSGGLDAPAPPAGSAFLFVCDGTTFEAPADWPTRHGPQRFTWAAAADDIWFVLPESADGPRTVPAEIIRWNGATFDKMAIPHRHALNIHGSGSTDVWLAGSTVVYHWGG